MHSIVTTADKAKLKSRATKLIDQFDLGLKAKMKVAASAKTDSDARKAAAVGDVVTEYRKSIKDASTQWGIEARTIVEPLDKVLVRIQQHGVGSMKSRPPIWLDRELDEVRATFDKGAAGARAGVPTLGLDDDDEADSRHVVEIRPLGTAPSGAIGRWAYVDAVRVGTVLYQRPTVLSRNRYAGCPLARRAAAVMTPRPTQQAHGPRGDLNSRFSSSTRG
jgi:hypothetical protein